MAKNKNDDEFEDELDQEFNEKTNKEEDEMFDEELDVEEKKEFARNQPVSIKRVSSPQAHKPLPQRASPIADEQRNTSQTENKFSVYSVPERMGIIDSEENKPLIEAQDSNTLVLLTLVNIMNRLERIERNLSG